MHLAIASVPMQKWNIVYDEAQALKKGTLFPELDLPFFVTEQDQAMVLRAEVPGSYDDVMLQVQQIC